MLARGNVNSSSSLGGGHNSSCGLDIFVYFVDILDSNYSSSKVCMTIVIINLQNLENIRTLKI